MLNYPAYFSFELISFFPASFLSILLPSFMQSPALLFFLSVLLPNSLFSFLLYSGFCPPFHPYFSDFKSPSPTYNSFFSNHLRFITNSQLAAFCHHLPVFSIYKTNLQPPSIPINFILPSPQPYFFFILHTISPPTQILLPRTNSGLQFTTAAVILPPCTAYKTTILPLFCAEPTPLHTSLPHTTVLLVRQPPSLNRQVHRIIIWVFTELQTSHELQCWVLQINNSIVVCVCS